MLTANTFGGDPNTKTIFTAFQVSDSFFFFAYVFLNDYVYPQGVFGFTAFPKVFFAISFYFYFDDRLTEIFYLFIVTTLTSYLTGTVSEELMADCYHEDITEFHTIDYYALMYLDIPYIAKKCYGAI